MTPDVTSPFGTFDPSPSWARLLSIAQHAPRNAAGKTFARLLRWFYLKGARLPADVTIGDLRLRCYLRDNTCERKFVFTPWRFDALERSAITQALPPDGIFVDIGANVGIHTLSAATGMGAAGRVVALEPYPPAFARLTFNIAATRGTRVDWPRIDALPLGVADSAAPRALRIDSGNLGGGSIAEGTARFSGAGASEQVSIECRPLLAILNELGIRRVDALKIDIEGAEDQALIPFVDDAPETLLPGCIVIENSDHLWKRDIRSALARRGYREKARSRLNTVFARA